MIVLAVGISDKLAAADEVLMHGEGGEPAITTLDVLADAQRIPSEARGKVLGRPENVARLASSLYVYRSFAARAEAEGLADDPATAAALRVARDKVLSDAWLARIDANARPDEKKLEALARLQYKGSPDRFMAPELIHVRHILLGGHGPDVLVEAEALLARINAGEDFGRIARESSRDPASAENDGDLGFLTRGKMPPEFDDAAFALEMPGEVSLPVKTAHGYHLIRLEERRPASVLPFEEVQDPLVREMTIKMLQDARAAAAEDVRASATIDDAAIERFASRQSPE